jgi:F420-non-reducing hydrogenase iron-sulfur subunit
MKAFEPKVVGFLCNWCSYAGADSAGARKLEVPAEFSVIRMMCSGRVEPQMVLKALSEGADAVAIFGCHFGDCHYQEGNHSAFVRYHLMRKMLGEMGIEPERLRLEWVSATEGVRFAELVREIVDVTRKLGPLKVVPGQVPGEVAAGGEA